MKSICLITNEKENEALDSAFQTVSLFKIGAIKKSRPERDHKWQRLCNLRQTGSVISVEMSRSSRAIWWYIFLKLLAQAVAYASYAYKNFQGQEVEQQMLPCLSLLT